MNIKITENGNALVSKAFAKRAAIYGTQEYKLWREIKEDFPNAKMNIKGAKNTPFRNLTYSNIEKYIKYIDNEEQNIMSEYKKIKKLSIVQVSPYKFVREWFETKFPDYRNSVAFCEKENKETPKAEIKQFPAA